MTYHWLFGGAAPPAVATVKCSLPVPSPYGSATCTVLTSTCGCSGAFGAVSIVSSATMMPGNVQPLAGTLGSTAGDFGPSPTALIALTR